VNKLDINMTPAATTESASSGGLSRRQFLKSTAALGALAAPALIPASALGKGGAVAPSERIVMGAIGIGGRGAGILNCVLGDKNVQFVAVCDVKESRREYVKNTVDQKYGNKDCATYLDLREFLAERTDIDALVIATGDRWHAPASAMAMRAGKDVYCEKPGSMTVAEGQSLVQTAQRYGRVFQTGTQRLSEAKFIFANELVRLGRLGKVHTVYAHILRFQMKTNRLPTQPEPAPDTLNWDLWLGPAPWRPYNEGYVRGCGGWLNYFDFGAGLAGWGSHTICQCQAAIGAAETSAVEYEYPGNDTAEGLVAHFANGVKLVLTCTGWRGTCGVRYEGTEGWVSVADGYERPDVSSPLLLREFHKVVMDYAARKQGLRHHPGDFLDSVRTRRPCVANEVVMHRTMTTNHAANVCMLLKRNVKWDPTKEEFVSDPEANRYLSRAMREPWRM
jgi:hypothetical protein